MSPSEAEAVALGVLLDKSDRTDKRNDAGKRLRFYRFVFIEGRSRASLGVFWHTRAGAWQAAARWVKRLKDGRLK